MKKQILRVEVVSVPAEDAEQRLHAAYDLIADAVAHRILERARAEAAAELGLAPHQLGGARDDLGDLVRDLGRELVGGEP